MAAVLAAQRATASAVDSRECAAALVELAELITRDNADELGPLVLRTVGFAERCVAVADTDAAPSAQATALRVVASLAWAAQNLVALLNTVGLVDVLVREAVEGATDEIKGEALRHSRALPLRTASESSFTTSPASSTRCFVRRTMARRTI